MNNALHGLSFSLGKIILLDSMDYFNITPLPSHPHLNPLPEHLRPDGVDAVLLLEDLGGGKAVQNGLNRRPGVGKLHPLQLPAVHELHPLPEFSLLKPGGICGKKPLVRHPKRTDAVDAVNGGVRVIRIFKRLLPIDVPDVGGKIEVVLRKKDPHRLDGAEDGLFPFQLLILDLHDPVALDGLSDLPQTL